MKFIGENWKKDHILARDEGNTAALEKLNEIEKRILELAEGHARRFRSRCQKGNN